MKKNRGLKNRALRLAVIFFIALAVALSCLLAGPGDAEVGAFRVVDWQTEKIPEGAITLSDLEIEVNLDAGFAVVRLRETFENHTEQALRGSYFLKVPPEAMLMDFGVWDDGRWNGSVVIERKRGRSAFQEISERMVDPALLEVAEAEVTDGFQVSVAPLPGLGSRRVEAAYCQWLPVRSGARQFLLPLAAGLSSGPEKAEHLKLFIKVRDLFALAEPKITAGPDLAFTVTPAAKSEKDSAYTWSAQFDGGPIALTQDLALALPLKLRESQIAVLAYRDPDAERQDLSATGGQTYRDSAGYFLAESVFALPSGDTVKAPPATESAADFVILLDTSLSMQFEKLDQAVEVLTNVMNNLGPDDRFSLLTLGDEVSVWKNEPVPAGPAEKSEALAAVHKTPLTGGTNLLEGLKQARALLASSPAGRSRRVIVISDGDPTVGELKTTALLAALGAQDPSCPFYIFGLGEDTNVKLLKSLANDSGGYFAWARETEDLQGKLAAFLSAQRDQPTLGVRLSITPADGLEKIYPEGPLTVFNQESVSWVGRYLKPSGPVKAQAAGTRAGAPVTVTGTATLPERDAGPEFVRRLWAQRRVEYLLGRIEAEGEKKEWVDEIVALSREFKFPTPYTSYLVAPRAFLRPRVIRPRDPVLLVKAPEGTRSILALFPFGELHAMRYIESAEVWETRFLVPAGMKDGRYFCELVITDAGGAKSMEPKAFTVDSTPPRLKVRIAESNPRAGRTLTLQVDADPDTKTIRARLAALPAVEVKWDGPARINQGRLVVPRSWPPGEYQLEVTAEDFAHNVTRTLVPVRIGG